MLFTIKIKLFKVNSLKAHVSLGKTCVKTLDSVLETIDFVFLLILMALITNNNTNY